MGSCISKSKSSVDEEDDPDRPIQIQDKRVIITSSQSTPPSPLPKCKTPSSPPLFLLPPPPLQFPKCISSPSPPFSTPSTTSSLSSFSSTSSCTSSATSKDRSFSNEFLWSCAKEHPHVLQDEPKKQSPRKAAETKSSPTAAPQVPPRRPSLRPSSCSPKRSLPRRRMAPPSPTRVRSNSPPLARQRSFRNLGSSPGRRFGKENCNQSHNLKNNSKVAGAEYQMRTKIKEAGRPPASPSRLMKKETTGRDRKAPVDQADLIKKQSGLLHHIHQQSGREGRSEQEIESHPLEDIDNPHIALDCFIFL